MGAVTDEGGILMIENALLLATLALTCVCCPLYLYACGGLCQRESLLLD